MVDGKMNFIDFRTSIHESNFTTYQSNLQIFTPSKVTYILILMSYTLSCIPLIQALVGLIIPLVMAILLRSRIIYENQVLNRILKSKCMIFIHLPYNGIANLRKLKMLTINDTLGSMFGVSFLLPLFPNLLGLPLFSLTTDCKYIQFIRDERANTRHYAAARYVRGIQVDE
jgi:hypothetical protein